MGDAERLLLWLAEVVACASLAALTWYALIGGAP